MAANQDEQLQNLAARPPVERPVPMRVEDAIRALKELREHNALGGDVSVRDLIREGAR